MTPLLLETSQQLMICTKYWAQTSIVIVMMLIVLIMWIIVMMLIKLIMVMMMSILIMVIEYFTGKSQVRFPRCVYQKNTLMIIIICSKRYFLKSIIILLQDSDFITLHPYRPI